MQLTMVGLMFNEDVFISCSLFAIFNLYFGRELHCMFFYHFTEDLFCLFVCADVDVPKLSWKNLQIDALVDFLAYYLNWKPCYARQCILPILSTIFLREKASDPKDDMLLFGQYKFHSIHREKVRYKFACYVVKWKRDMPNLPVSAENGPFEESDALPIVETSVTNGLHPSLDDEPDIPEVLIEEGCSFLLSEENTILVESAFPNEVSRYLREKVRYPISILYFYCRCFSANGFYMFSVWFGFVFAGKRFVQDAEM